MLDTLGKDYNKAVSTHGKQAQSWFLICQSKTTRLSKQPPIRIRRKTRLQLKRLLLRNNQKITLMVSIFKEQKKEKIIDVLM